MTHGDAAGPRGLGAAGAHFWAALDEAPGPPPWPRSPAACTSFLKFTASGPAAPQAGRAAIREAPRASPVPRDPPPGPSPGSPAAFRLSFPAGAARRAGVGPPPSVAAALGALACAREAPRRAARSRGGQPCGPAAPVTQRPSPRAQGSRGGRARGAAEGLGPHHGRHGSPDRG